MKDDIKSRIKSNSYLFLIHSPALITVPPPKPLGQNILRGKSTAVNVDTIVSVIRDTSSWSLGLMSP